MVTLKNETFFTLYESRHYGWIIKKINKRDAEKILNSEDNTDVCVCVTKDKIHFDINTVIVENLDNFSVYKLNEVKCEIKDKKIFLS